MILILCFIFLASESEGEEDVEDEEEEEPTLMKTMEDTGSEDGETNAEVEDASPALLPEDAVEEKGVVSGKEEEDDEEEEETLVVEPRTLRRREDMKVTSTPKAGSDVSASRTGKIDTVVTMPKLSLVSPRKDIEDTTEMKMETEEATVEAADDEAAGETKRPKETESVVGKNSEFQLDAAPTECPKIEKVEKATSDEEKVDKKQAKPRTRRREGTRMKPAAKLTTESPTKVEETAMKLDDVESDKDVTATETEEQAGVDMEEDGADGDEKPEKGRKRTKVTKEKPLEKTPKSKGKLEKGLKGRPAKLKKSDTTTTPSEGVEVKIKKRVKRKLVEKATNEEEGSSDVSEKEAPSEVTEPGVKSEKTEAKPTTVIDNVLDRVVPSNDVVAAGVADDVAASPRAAQCASPDRLGSPTPEAPKLWDSVSVDINAVQESPSEKAPDLSPITGAGHPQKNDADLPATSAKPEGASTDAKVSPALKAEASTAIFDNTPPSTPEHPSSVTATAEHGEDSSSRDQSSNRTDEVYSTKSEYEANLEVAVLMAEAAAGHGRNPAEVPTQVCESPIACDMSTMSNSSGGSSGNAPGSESEEPPSGSLQKDDDDSGEPTPKRRKRTHKRPVPAAPPGAVAEKVTHRLNVAPTAKPECEYFRTL